VHVTLALASKLFLSFLVASSWSLTALLFVGTPRHRLALILLVKGITLLPEPAADYNDFEERPLGSGNGMGCAD
jgi:hypothetical protein